MPAEATRAQIERTQQPAPRYWAFISYSHRDRAWGDWLHHSLETYRVPKTLVSGAIPPRIFPVFRDREELAGSANLPEKIKTALAESRNLIVICSPHSAASRWVNEEISYFAQLGRADRIFLLIVAGEPHAKDPAQECFPPSLRFKPLPDEQGKNQPADYLAADARPVGDGKKNALLKLIAGVLDVDYDKLKRLDHERQVRLRTIWISALALLVMVLSGLAGYAWWERGQAKTQQHEAETQRDEAKKQKKEADIQRDEAKKQKREADTQRDEANKQRDLAEERQHIAVSRQLAAQALNQMVEHPDLALLLAVEAQRPAKTFEANNSVVKILEHESGAIIMLHGNTIPVTQLAISPDGKMIASGGADGTVRLWSSDGHALTAGPIYQHKVRRNADGEWSYSPDPVDTLVFSPDSAWLASGSVNGIVQVEDVRQKKPYGKEINYYSLIHVVGFTLGGHRLIIAAGGNRLIDFDFDTGREIGPEFSVGGQPLSRAGFAMVAIRADGKLVVPDADHKHIHVFDLATHHPIGEAFNIARGWPDQIGRKDQEIFLLRVSPDGKTMATADLGGSVQVWNLPKGQWAGQSVIGDEEEGRRVLAIAFDDESKRLTWVNGDGSIRALENDRGGGWGLAPNTIFADPIQSAAFSADGSTVALGSRSGLVRLWDLRERHQPLGRGIHTRDFLNAVAVSPDSNSAAVSGDFVPNTGEFSFAHRNYSIDFWNLYSGEKLHSMKSGNADKLAFSKDGRTLAAADRNQVSLYEIPKGDPFAIPVDHPTRIDSIAITPDNTLVIAGDFFKSWKIKERAWRGPSQAYLKDADFSVISPDGSLLATVDYHRNGTTRLWSIATGKQIGSTMKLGGQIRNLAFSPDNRIIATEGEDGRLELWDIRTHLPVGKPIPWFSKYISRLVFSPDGQLLVALGSYDPVTIVDVPTQQPLGDPISPVAKNEFMDAAFSPDGKVLALVSRSKDDTDPSGEFYALDVKPAAWVERACKTANRNLTKEEWGRYFGDEPYQKTCPKLPGP